jgi:hypothetical protein
MKQVIINEIIGNDGNLIDKSNDKPEISTEIANMSSKTTDANVGIGRQPANSDEYLGQMGFNFRESEEKENTDILDILAELEFEQYKSHVKYFLDNLNKSEIIKYKELLKKDFNDLSDEEKKSDYVYAKKTIKALKDKIKTKKTIEEDSDILTKKLETSFLTKSDLANISSRNNKFEKITDILTEKIKTTGDLLVIIKQLIKKSQNDVLLDVGFKSSLISYITNIVENKK